MDVNITGSGYHVGGLVGYVDRGNITGCCATGSTRGNHQVGGLVGANESGTLNACYATGPADGNVFVGGLVGYNHGTITSCYSTGSVSGATHVGGLSGYTVQGSVTHCYATGSVSASQWNVGGLVGSSFGSSLTACYSTGSVTGSFNLGGLVGFNESDSTVSACFWDIEASGQTVSAAGTGKTTAEMQRQNTFTDARWDFVGETKNGTEDIWWINEGKGYPRLWWERQPVIELDSTNFDAQIAHGVILVDFFATWCPHCTTQAPIVEEVAERVKGRALVAKLDVDQSRAIAQRYGVSAIPTLILFQDGVQVRRFVGVTAADVLVSAILAAVESLGQ